MWIEKNLLASRLEPLRMVGDALVDSALEAFDVKTGEDAIMASKEYTARPEGEQESLAPGLLMKHLMTVLEWLEWEQVKRAGSLLEILLLHLTSLAPLLPCRRLRNPEITKVLNSTGYLSGKRTKERILETAPFILDVAHSLEYLQPGTGNGW